MNKIIKVLLTGIFVMAMVSTASAGKDFGQQTFDNLKDQIIAIASAESDQYALAYTQAIAGADSEATAYSTGYGNYLSLMSGIYMQVDDPVTGVGNAYITAESVGVNIETFASSPDNSISIVAYAQGVGDAQGYTWVFGWE